MRVFAMFVIAGLGFILGSDALGGELDTNGASIAPTWAGWKQTMERLITSELSVERESKASHSCEVNFLVTSEGVCRNFHVREKSDDGKFEKALKKKVLAFNKNRVPRFPPDFDGPLVQMSCRASSTDGCSIISIQGIDGKILRWKTLYSDPSLSRDRKMDLERAEKVKYLPKQPSGLDYLNGGLKPIPNSVGDF